MKESVGALEAIYLHLLDGYMGVPFSRQPPGVELKPVFFTMSKLGVNDQHIHTHAHAHACAHTHKEILLGKSWKIR